MKRLRNHPVPGLALACCLLGAAAAPAQAPANLSGSWEFQTTMALLEGQLAPCLFAGTANIVHSGVTISGNATMVLVNGDPPCPAESSAVVTGQVNGTAVTLLLDGGNLGVAVLNGEHVAGFEYSGSMGLESGPIDASGTWTAIRGAATAIPTVGVVGLAALVLLLATASLVTLRARSLT